MQATPLSKEEPLISKEEALEIFNKLKENPTIEVDVGDYCFVSLSFRGGEWVLTVDAERTFHSEEEYDKDALWNIEYYFQGLEDIKYCDDCGKELQIDPYHVCN